MDALDRVLRREKNELSRNTILTIIEAADKISETVQQDFNSQLNTSGEKAVEATTSKAGQKVLGRSPAARSTLKKKS